MDTEPEINPNHYIKAATFLAVCSTYEGYNPLANTNNDATILWLNFSLLCFKQILGESAKHDLTTPNGNPVISDNEHNFENAYLCVGSLLRAANEFGVGGNIVSMLPRRAASELHSAEELLASDATLAKVTSEKAQPFFDKFQVGMHGAAQKIYAGFVDKIKQAYGLSS